MNIFKKINNVKSFLIDSKHIYFVNIIDKSLFKIDFALNQIDSFKEFNSYEIVDYYDFIINYSLLFVNKEKFQKNIEILNNFNLTLVNTINEQEILVKKIDDEAKKVHYLKINLKSKKETEIKNISFPKIVQKGNVICSDTTFLSSHNIENGQELWRLDLNTVLNNTGVTIYEGKILAVNNNIIVSIHDTDFKKYSTICIDIITGEIVHRTQDILFKLYQNEDIIYQISPTKIKQFNPSNFEISYMDLEEFTTNHDLKLSNKVAFFHENHIYISAEKENSNVNSFWLIVNLQTGKVVYSSELLIDPKKVSTENNRAFVSEIQANDKIVAIKSSQTLFIFEKEETILQ